VADHADWRALAVKVGFILPSAEERNIIGACSVAVRKMRQDQIDHLEHLIRSWRISSAAEAWRAVKRTLRDKP
jgi:hypothetical protein